MRNRKELANNSDPAIQFRDSIGWTGYYKNDYIPAPKEQFNAPDLDVVKVVGNELPEQARDSLLTLPAVRVEETVSRLVYRFFGRAPQVAKNLWNGRVFVDQDILAVATAAKIPSVPQNRPAATIVSDMVFGNNPPDSTTYRIPDLPVDGSC